MSKLESCINVCHTLPECSWWVFGTEEGMTKCWLRVADDGRENGDGWSSGAKTCAPPDTAELIMGELFSSSPDQRDADMYLL